MRTPTVSEPRLRTSLGERPSARCRLPLPLSSRARGAALVFVLSFATLWAVQARDNPSWVPRGADWDSWILSALAITVDVPYPMSRWPLYGGLTAALDLALVGQPIFIAAQLCSMFVTAVMIMALWRVARALIGAPGAWAMAPLTLMFPTVLEQAVWANGYALWCAAAAVAVMGLVELARGEDQRWALVSGAGVAGVLAVMDKGLGLGLMLLGLAGLTVAGLAARAPAGARLGVLGRLSAFGLGPVLALALAYAVFPEPLASLDAQVRIAEGSRAPGVMPTGDGGRLLPPPTTPGGGSLLDEGGYVFGRSMSPATVLQAVRATDAGEAARAERLTRSLDDLRATFPGASREVLWGLGLGGLTLLGVGLLGLRRGRPGALVGALGLGVTVAGVLPALYAENLQLRFLTPALTLTPLLALAPLAALTRRLPILRYSPLALALWLGLVWEESPYRRSDLVLHNMANGGAELATRVWYSLDRRLPDEVIHVMEPVRGGLFLLEGRGGAVLETPQATPPQDGWLVIWHQGQLDPSQVVGAPASVLDLSRFAAQSEIAPRRIATVFTEDVLRGWLVLLAPPGDAGALERLGD